eukprot:5356081-Alexandrium_andersonii.AAC.1
MLRQLIGSIGGSAMPALPWEDLAQQRAVAGAIAAPRWAVWRRAGRPWSCAAAAQLAARRRAWADWAQQGSAQRRWWPSAGTG